MRNLFSDWEQNGHSTLLLAVVTITVVSPFIVGLPSMRWLMVLMLLTVLLAAVRTLHSNRTERWIALVLALVAALSQIGNLLNDASWIDTVKYGTLILFLLLISVLLLRDIVVRSHGVNTQLILGSINIYLLVGLTFAFIYGLVESLHAGSFSGIERAGVAQEPMPRFIYFSYVTLTTLGYGDIAPLTTTAKTLAYVQAVFGQLYLAILVARLVGLHISSSSGQDH